jgi:multidrug resistance efflux pump
VDLALRERRDLEVEKLRRKYAPKLATLQDQVQRAGQRVEREQGQYSQQKMSTAISVGATILGALLGRKAVSASSLGRATTALRGASRIGREKGDVGRAQESLQATQTRLQQLQEDADAEVAALQGRYEAGQVELVPVQVRPRKPDIAVSVGLAWVPYRVGADGLAAAAFDTGWVRKAARPA